MGIFINLSISQSVTPKEWESVYEETLQLIKHLPLAERREVEIHGIETICLVKTEEHRENYGRNKKRTRMGWEASGDYNYMIIAENYYLPRVLVDENEVEPDAGDALLGAIPSYLDYDWKDERFTHVYELWGNKTQGRPYHLYLLAVAALIEARLGEKAFTYGNITRGQFKKAVEIANQYIKEPIDLPDRCHVDRLMKRVTKLPLSESEQLAVFEKFFLGTQDAEFGDCMRQMFTEEAITEQEKYDVSDSEDLLFFKEGDSIHPSVEKPLAESMKFLLSLLEEDSFAELMASTPDACCRWLVEQNRYILMRDTDWDKIFTNIENDINLFGRYYSMFRVKLDDDDLVKMCRALILNDDLYEYSKLLMNKLSD